MPIYDYECTYCKYTEEILAKLDEKIHCKTCNAIMNRLISAPHIFTTIIPTYPGSKKLKAGYQHIDKPQSATKLQMGYGGGQSPENPRR